ncbi:hypothetical protein LX15_000400 [Streptoalloteichus tenebrarius]|uniref:DUF308 domain-containing protein n=1 Tax=Streptoalloteichus tenebrarius (strain ATCC 17920 / DSM 40477 / JCM 4838 / CBS 697.72 / NBRC 16177 / NCIMB 11028 / NRRL B-12390 / A12253. 1 / ISP 5477) TaxID=1933 RepID=A0ABT1HMI2_STRSD|nr:hypothetical protein [Streptoalloteichus tenebrarius]MCP2256717.1 hypothetical protein [Streptoalloteichus tenebrarius]BFF00382.1 hypothetical protein GCM10020241_20570 [Streptoalloteichus tenebrarius]
MNGRPPSQDGPENVDAAFAEIVADLEREGGLRWPDPAELDERLTPPTTAPVAAGAGDRALAGAEPAPVEPAAENRADHEDHADEHYVPPEPPPLPPLRAPTVGALTLLVVGVLLLVVPSLVGWSHQLTTPLALVSLTAGIGWLVLRMRQGPPPDSGWDDGAQV